MAGLLIRQLLSQNGDWSLKTAHIQAMETLRRSGSKAILLEAVLTRANQNICKILQDTSDLTLGTLYPIQVTHVTHVPIPQVDKERKNELIEEQKKLENTVNIGF